MLNEAQQEAVNHVNGPLLVFACAGSGKTRVITHRVVKLIKDEHVDPERILLVTFTNKAAEEMRSRMVSMIDEKFAKKVCAGTFHSICAKILRGYSQHTNRTRKFSIYDDKDSENLIRMVIEQLGFKGRPGMGEGMQADDAAQFIQHCKQKLVRKFIHRDKYESPDLKLIAVRDRYESLMQTCDAFDFEDLIYETVMLFEQEEVGDSLRKKWDFVLVDEFQDTNASQAALINHLARDHRNVCCVGDDDQAIYSFRGADVKNIRNFAKVWNDAKVITLTKNYRSTRCIVEAAKVVISSSKDRTPKAIETDNALGSPIQFIPYGNDIEEGMAISNAAKDKAPGTFAVIYRTHSMARRIEGSLRLAGVKYNIKGGHGFFDRKEIMDCMAYLKLACNPNSNADFMRVVNMPPRGLGSVSVMKIEDVAKEKNISMFQAASLTDIDKKYRPSLDKFCESVSSAIGSMKPGDAAKKVLHASGYLDYWKDEANEYTRLGKQAKATDAEERSTSVLELMSWIERYQSFKPSATLLEFVNDIQLDSADDKKEVAEVTLTTIHAAKGLEFDSVWVPGAEEGIFPFASVYEENPAEAIEEETRLAYVAFTRARKNLVLSYCDQRMRFGKMKSMDRSRFIDLFLGSQTEKRSNRPVLDSTDMIEW